MKDFHKKESPFQGITGLAGGATGLRMAGVAAKPKYIDEVFSNYLYDGNQTARSITNNIDLTKGGLVWTKNREITSSHYLVDTVRGAGKGLYSNSMDAEANVTDGPTSFNSNGFSTGSSPANSHIYWTFRKAENFFI